MFIFINYFQFNSFLTVIQEYFFNLKYPNNLISLPLIFSKVFKARFYYYQN